MRRLLMLVLLVAVVGTTAIRAASAKTAVEGGPAARHVLLLSVDGLHQSDLAWYVDRHPSSALAKLVHRGVATSIQVFGQPTDAVVEMLRRQADAGVPLNVKPYHLGGFTRWPK
jgi:hypothetical protein